MMASLSMHHPLVYTFGILGNMISFMVYLAPLPTFYRIIQKKSTEGFHSVPYVVALFSAMLWLYYASLKPHEILLITINSFGCVAETIYIAIFSAYAPKKAKIQTLRLLLVLGSGAFGLILVLTQVLAQGPKRALLLGWICVVFAVSVFAAPLSIMRQVMRTKSVEFMPFWLSFTLALSAVMWFLYGLLLKDFFIAVPNIVGFTLGVLQMVLYLVYKDSEKDAVLKNKLQTIVLKPEIVKNSEVHPITFTPIDMLKESSEDVGEQVASNITIEVTKMTESQEMVIDASNKV